MSGNQQLFPFSTAQPFRNGDPFLGGQIVILPPGTSSSNALFAHALKRLPRAFFVLDIGTQTPMTTPFARGSSAWSHAQFSLAIPALAQPVTGVLL